MATRNKFEELLEYIVNGEQKKADELFHSLVVEKSREIYEGLYEEELSDVDLEEASEEDDEDMEENADLDKVNDIAASLKSMSKSSSPKLPHVNDIPDDNPAAAMFKVDENEEDEEFDMEEIGGDPSDDMMNDIEDSEEDEGDEDGDDEPITKSDLEAALDDLKAEFERLMSGDSSDDSDMDNDMDMDTDDEKKEMFAPAFEEEIEEIDLSPAEQMREYVEKIGDAYKGGKVASSSEASGANTKSVVAKKNDMGGTTANIAKGGTGSEKGTAGGLLNPSTKEENAGNVNVPGGKGATKLSAVAKGHGAEKKGAGEDAQNKKSIIGSR